jgi:hypothetical protein
MRRSISLPKALLLTLSLFGCGDSGKIAEDKRITEYVAATINDLVRPETAQQGLDVLSVLPLEAVPYVVARLGDSRGLPVTKMTLENRSPGRFEATRHIYVRTVDDALRQALNQTVGERIGDWRSWCVQKYPDKAEICNRGSPH